MIIHKPKTEIKGNAVRVSAYVEVETNKDLSGTLWFEFNKEYKKYISKTCNGFLANMLLLAMYLNEDIEVKGKISPKLEHGLDQVQDYFSFWRARDFPYFNPRKFHKIKIKHEGFVVENTSAKNVLCTFSGGVDSFYTLLKHLPQNEPYKPHQITHCLHVDGFNKPLSKDTSKFYNIYHNRFKKMEKKNNLKIIRARSNYEDFYIKKYKAYSPCHYGVTLSSMALFLTPLACRFYVASSYEYSTFKPEGSNPITDPMLSTETLDVIHYDCSASRIDKVKEISHWEETYDKLMVCFDEEENNCCNCEKCIRTMLTLHLAGTLSKYKTFPEKLTSKKVRNWNEKNKTHLKEVVDYAKEVHNNKILRDIKYNRFKVAIRRFKEEKIGDKYPFSLNGLWALIWLPSAILKKRSKSYRKFVKLIKKIIKSEK